MKELDTRGGSTCKSNLGQFSMFCRFKNSKVYMSSEFRCYNSSCYSLQMTNEFFLQTNTNEDAVRERWARCQEHTMKYAPLEQKKALKALECKAQFIVGFGLTRVSASDFKVVIEVDNIFPMPSLGAAPHYCFAAQHFLSTTLSFCFVLFGKLCVWFETISKTAFECYCAD